MAMRAAALFLMLPALAATPAIATTCVTVSIDVRRAEVVAVARYAGDRTFVVESTLRTVGDRPAKLVAPEDWLSSPCGTKEPVAGQAYFVARFPRGPLAFREVERTATERALIERLHPVTAAAILDVLERYSRGEATREETDDWLQSAMADWGREGSFTVELLEVAESLVNDIRNAEPCHPDVVRAIREDELPRALTAIAAIVPAVDAEAEFVARRVADVADPALRDSLKEEALDEWEGTLEGLGDAVETMKRALGALPWCDHRKHGR